MSPRLRFWRSLFAGPARRAVRLGTVERLEDRSVPSSVPYQVADLNTDPNTTGSAPHDLTAVGSKVFFAADTLTTGTELWTSDGTAAGTVLVKDIRGGTGASQPHELTNVNGTLFFTATDDVNGAELWKSDGTAAGTTIVKDIYPGALSGYPANLTAVNGTLFFSARSTAGGVELWKSDGTAAGTVLVKDISSGTPGSYPHSFAAVGGTLYFTADNGTSGSELWKSDGTAAGTVLVKDIASGSSSSLPKYLTNANGTLFFTASTGTSVGLWKSDGTAAGTALLKTIQPPIPGSLYNGGLTAVGGKVFFSNDDGTTGQELWSSDGTVAGTALVKDIYPGTYGSQPDALVNFNGTLYFSSKDPTNGGELWKSDGTAAGTTLVKDIKPGTGASYLRYTTVVANTLYFRAGDGVHGLELWKSDGAAAGTVHVAGGGAAAGASPKYLTAVNGKVVYAADGANTGTELWQSDGTPAGTGLVKDIYAGTNDGSPGQMIDFNGALYFQVYNSPQLWRSDGTAAGTVAVATLGSPPDSFSVVNGRLFFRADNKLWKTDGTPAGTAVVKDYSGIGTISGNLTAAGNALVFTASDATNGDELWASDGTEAGTRLVKDVYPGSFNSAIGDLTFVGGTLFFTALDGTHGRELWRSDGTAAGTVLLADLYAGSFGASPHALVDRAGVLYFVARKTGASTVSLWRSDGTTAGTALVKDLLVGEITYPAQLATVGGVLYLTARDAANGYELWTSDGTTAGTVLVKDINPGAADSSPTMLTDVGGAVYFVAGAAAAGRELWRSDGTTAGTVLVKDIFPGASSSNVSSLRAVNGALFFVATDPTHGFELWRGGGTAAGAVIASGPPLEFINSLTVAGNHLFFAAATDAAGQELWAVTITPPTDLSLAPAAVAENRPGGTVVGAFAATDADAGETFTYALVPGAGATDNAAFTVVGGALVTAAAFDFEAKASYAIRVRVTDSGGFTFEKALTVAVTNVNESPFNLALSGTTVAENQPAGTAVGTFAAADPDAGDTFAYALVSGTGSTDNALFAVTGGTLVTAAPLDYETQSSYSIRVRVTDAGGLTFEKVLTVAATNVNEAPTDVAVLPATVAENRPAGTTVGALTTNDPDATAVFSYALVPGAGAADNAAFTVIGGALVTAAAFDFEAKASYAIRVRTTDAGGLSVEKALTIAVTNVNEAPTDLALVGATVAENRPAGAVVGALAATDPDAGDTFAYALAPGAADNALFAVSGGALVTAAAFDFETRASYSVRVRVTDAGGLTFEKALAVTVTDANDAPTAVTLTAAPVVENQPAGTTVGTFAAADPDAGDTFTYALVPGAGSADNAMVTVSGNTLLLAAPLDFETRATLSVRVRATDAGGLFVERTVAVAVANANEAPTGVSLSNATVAESAPVGTAVAALAAADPDAGDTFTYALVPGSGADDNAAFTVAAGALLTATKLDFETTPTLSVRVRVTDAGGLTFERALTVAVTNANDAPTDVGLTTGTVAENQPAGTTVGALTVADADAGDTFTYALVPGPGAADNAAFAIRGGSLVTARRLDFETTPTLSVRVRVTDAGGLTFERALTVAVTDAADPTAASITAVGGSNGGLTVLGPDGAATAALTPFPGFAGEVRTATTASGLVVAGTGPGRATQVKVLDPATQAVVFQIDPFEASFTGGVYVAAGDVTGDGVADIIITPDEGGGPRVDVYSGRDFARVTSFFGIDDPNFRGGARAATADLTADGVADLVVVAGFGGGPRVAAFDGLSLAGTPRKVFGDFFAFEQTLRNGIFIAAGDVNGDGFADLIAGGGPGGGPRVTVFDGRSLLTNQYVPLGNFFGGDVNSRGGIRVAAKDLDGDDRADIVVGAGAGAGSRVTAYRGASVAPGGTPPAAFDLDVLPGVTGGVFVG